MKHAYLILAHSNWNQLVNLIKLLDDNRNDIYLHIDKSKRPETEMMKKIISAPRCSKLYFVNSINANWGGYSMVKAELTLLRAATAKNYAYYHLLSGMDLPLKTQDEIHSYFDLNKGTEFIQYSVDSAWVRQVRSRYQYYWLFCEHSRRNKSLLWKTMNKLSLSIQKAIGIDRIKSHSLAVGSQWYSITDNLARYICDKEKEISKRYRNTFISDESAIQTIVAESNFSGNVFWKASEYNVPGNLRRIDWTRGKPYVWREEDFITLIQSECLFARKFDDSIDSVIIDRIRRFLEES